MIGGEVKEDFPEGAASCGWRWHGALLEVMLNPGCSGFQVIGLFKQASRQLTLWAQAGTFENRTCLAASWSQSGIFQGMTS